MSYLIIDDKITRVKVEKNLPNGNVEVATPYGKRIIAKEIELSSLKEAEEKLQSIKVFTINMGKKRCPKCGETLDISLFSKNKYNKDGLQVNCKSCISKWYRERKLKEGKKVLPAKNKKGEGLEELENLLSPLENKKKLKNIKAPNLKMILEMEFEKLIKEKEFLENDIKEKMDRQEIVEIQIEKLGETIKVF